MPLRTNVQGLGVHFAQDVPQIEVRIRQIFHVQAANFAKVSLLATDHGAALRTHYPRRSAIV